MEVVRSLVARFRSHVRKRSTDTVTVGANASYHVPRVERVWGQRPSFGGGQSILRPAVLQLLSELRLKASVNSNRGPHGQHGNTVPFDRQKHMRELVCLGIWNYLMTSFDGMEGSPINTL